MIQIRMGILRLIFAMLKHLGELLPSHAWFWIGDERILPEDI